MLYKISLKPTGSFYFGGENSFGEARSRGTDNFDIAKNYFAKRSAYFAESEYFPQQTQLLGMLRKEIMRRNDCLKLHNNGECIVKGKKETAVSLVGQNWEKDLGKIISLSSVFLEKKNDLYIAAPFDKNLTLEKVSGVSYINGRQDDKHVYAFKTLKNEMFGAKDSLAKEYVSSASSVKLEDIFTSISRVGNQTLGYTDDDDEEQLYKMVSYRLNKEFSFVCYLDLKEDLFNLKDNRYESLVELGGERSSFKLEVSEVNDADTVMKKCDAVLSRYEKEQSRIILLSDSYVPNTIFEYADVSLAEKVTFRTINSNQNGFSKSSKMVLLKRGTVFFVKENEEKKIREILENEKSFRKIGYNQYINIEKNKG